ELANPVCVLGGRLFSRTVALSADWRRDVTRSGGMTLESGVHEVDTVRWLGGEIVSIGGNVVYADPEYPDYDTDFRGIFKLQSGATGAVGISGHLPIRDWSWGSVGAKGMALRPPPGQGHGGPAREGRGRTEPAQ